MTMNQPLNLLIVDDDEIQNFITELLLKKLNIINNKFLHNGDDAFTFLQEKINSGKDELPTHILLDINMPMVDGLSFLKMVSDAEPLCHAPIKIAILTTSVRPQDRIEALTHKQVTHFIEKPITKEKLEEFLCGS